MGNEQSSTHEPKPAEEQPVRSALSRSRSVRSHANAFELKSQSDPKYLPSNAHRPTSSLLKHTTTMPYTAQNLGVEPFSSGTGGYESPQWGWYINTTPPSPEMYYSSRTTKSRKPDLSDASDTSSGGSSTATAMTCHSQPNPVFRCLQDKHKTAPMGWPSVPL